MSARVKAGRARGYFLSLAKARVPAALELAEGLEGELAWRRFNPLGGGEDELASELAEVRELLARLREHLDSLPVPPAPPPRVREGDAAERALQLSMLLEDIADFAAESGDPVAARLARRLRAKADSIRALSRALRQA